MKIRMLGITALMVGLSMSSSPGAIAQADAIDPLAPARFTAFVGKWDETDTHAPFGVTDERASGVLTVELEELTLEGGTPNFTVLEVLAFRIDNDGGSWSGSGLRTFGSGQAGFLPIATATLIGDGDYQGLTMLLYPDGISNDDPYWGIIIPTADIPEPPALAPAE